MLVLKLLREGHIFLCLLCYKEVFLLFLIFLFQVKILTRYENQIIFLGTAHLLQEISCITIFIVIFKKSSLNSDKYLYHINSFIGNF